MLKTAAAALALSQALSVGIGVRSSPAGDKVNYGGCGVADCQKERIDRRRIMEDNQKTQKSVAKPGGSTGLTVPPKPTQGNKNK
jgi:hypothetical protein